MGVKGLLEALGLPRLQYLPSWLGAAGQVDQESPPQALVGPLIRQHCPQVEPVPRVLPGQRRCHLASVKVREIQHLCRGETEHLLHPRTYLHLPDRVHGAPHDRGGLDLHAGTAAACKQPSHRPRAFSRRGLHLQAEWRTPQGLGQPPKGCLNLLHIMVIVTHR
ncbi:hypothetical protein G6F24_016790 [Rhizopus arrhizus]|nr:hypothetical protein G6F24_016790 [Rhizopus arrhizus]